MSHSTTRTPLSSHLICRLLLLFLLPKMTSIRSLWLSKALQGMRIWSKNAHLLNQSSSTEMYWEMQIIKAKLHIIKCQRVSHSRCSWPTTTSSMVACTIRNHFRRCHPQMNWSASSTNWKVAIIINTRGLGTTSKTTSSLTRHLS